LRSKKKLVAEEQREMQFFSNEDKEKWIEDYVERETARERKRVENAEAAVRQEQGDLTQIAIVGWISREHEKTIEKRLVAIGDCLSDLISSDDGENGEN
jgi:hypothetical protein